MKAQAQQAQLLPAQAGLPVQRGRAGEEFRGIVRMVVKGHAARIGPEGGFDDTEVTAALEAGYAPVRLGPTTLRAETAALAACAVALFGASP